MSDIYKSIDEMVDLLRQKIILMHELKRALMLAELLDIPVKDVKGSIRHVAFDLDYRPVQRWKGMVLRVTYDGTTQDFPLAVVPHDFWPAEVLAEYKRHVKRNQKHKE